MLPDLHEGLQSGIFFWGFSVNIFCVSTFSLLPVWPVHLIPLGIATPVSNY
jgi:hypothetical protein